MVSQQSGGVRMLRLKKSHSAYLCEPLQSLPASSKASLELQEFRSGNAAQPPGFTVDALGRYFKICTATSQPWANI